MNTLSSSFEKNPDLDRWLAIKSEGRVSLFSGKVELGQRIKTALAMIAAEELDIDLSRIDVEAVNTRTSPNEIYTAGSMSMENSGSAVRQAAAEARRIMLQAAAAQFGCQLDELQVNDGEIRQQQGGKRTSYWEIHGDKKFGIAVTGQATPKSPDRYQLVGKKIEPLDIKKLVTGASRYLHDLELPDMAHGRVVRPPNYHAQIDSIDLEGAKSMPGVLKVIRDGRFLAVIAEREEQAINAAARLNKDTVWLNSKELPTGDLMTQLTRNKRTSRNVVGGIPNEEPILKPKDAVGAAKKINANFFRPYHMHASMAPSAALAEFNNGILSIYTHSQGVYPLRGAIADVLDLDVESVVVTHVPGPGCYGHNGADDAGLDAALLARALPNRPVLLKWMREDEHGWEPYSSAMAVEISADVDAAGNVLAWNHDTYSDTHQQRPSGLGKDKSKLLAAWHLENPLPAPDPQPSMMYHAGIHRNADPIYKFQDRNITKHLVHDLPLRVSSTRSLGAYANVFAIESFMDELAAEAERDPLEFRLSHLDDDRAKRVLTTAAETAGWHEELPNESWGRGLAFARYKNQKSYAAVVMEVAVDDYGTISLKRAVIAADAGQIVDPDGLTSQLEGGLIQSASWTLKEQVAFDPDGVTSRDWETYPILAFNEVPKIETILIDQPGLPYLGAGEATQGPTAAAIANAVYNAIGIRLRRIPFTPEHVRETAAA